METTLCLEDYQCLKKHSFKLYAKGQILSSERFTPILDFLELNITSKKLTVDSLIKLLSKIDGFFSIVIETDNHVFLITDKVSSNPLFYFISSEKINISDQFSKFGLNIDNEDGIQEFLHGGSVIGDNTLSKDVKSVNAACILKISKKYNKLQKYYYYRFGHFPKEHFKKCEFSASFNDILFKSFTRLKEYIEKNNFIPVVPLSGGIDSRLIAIMLNKVGVKNAICYTFGNDNHDEVKTSRNISKRLNFEWRFMPYTQKTWSEGYNTSIELLKYVGNHKSIPNVMESFAVKELFSDDEDYLFIPGHTLDVISGSHYSKDLLENSKNIESVYDSILRQHFNLFSMKPEIRNSIKKKISQECGNLKGSDCFDFFDWKERQSTFIVNTLRVYEFYGHSWHIPYWENDYLELFNQIPLEYKYKRNLCLNSLGELFPDYFNNYCIKKTKKNKIVNLLKSSLFYKIKNVIEYYLFSFFRKRLQLSIKQDYGLSRFGTFSLQYENLEEFQKKYASKTKAKSIFYFFAKDYLNKINK